MKNIGKIILIVLGVALIALSFVDNAQLKNIADVSAIDDPAALQVIYDSQKDAQLAVQTALEEIWPALVLPPRENPTDLSQVLAQLRRKPDPQEPPLGALLRDLMELIMREV